MRTKLFVLVAVLATVLAACTGPVEDCVTTDGGTQFCLSINPQGETETTPTEVPDDNGDNDSIVCTDDMADIAIPAGKTVSVESGCRVSGDVKVNGVALYDNDGSTGLLVDMTARGSVFAEWGASVNSTSVDEWVDLMKDSGCESGKGCSNVIVVTWPK